MSHFKSRRIRLVEFNVENLFVLMDRADPSQISTAAGLPEKDWQKLTSSTYANKPLAQVKELARAVVAMDPDILMLSEVGGRESLANFSRLFLGDRYAPYLIEGNSDRGIDLGYLCKRELPFTYELLSHKHKPIDFLYPHERQSIESGYNHLRSARRTSHRFSRDVLELRVREADADPDSQPVLIILLVHLKSQLDRSRIDPQGRDRRRAELEKLVKIYNETRLHFANESEPTPILLAGDFNGKASRPNCDSEFSALYQETELQDCLEIAQVPLEERFTHMQISNRGVGVNRQLDYIFVPPILHSRVNRAETWVFRFEDEAGKTMVIPRNFNEKRLLPSDHYPVVLTLDPA